MLISGYAKYLQYTLSSRLFEFAYKRIFSSIELGAFGYQYNKHALIKLPILKPDKPIIFDEQEIDKGIYKLYGITPEEQREIEGY